MKITFLGATKTVTGSKYLLSANQKHFLVDCGLFQGRKELRQRNWQPLPISPGAISAVILTHAHIDHSGYLPLLVKNGFTGKIYCSKATYDLCRVLLPDSGYLQEEEARQANLLGYSKHKPALPLYTRQEAELCLEQFNPVSFGHEYFLDDNLSFILNRAGHILGASFVTVHHADTSLLFSGDLGRPEDPIMPAPAEMQQADYLVIESTYGNRKHDTSDPFQQLADIIQRTVARKGSILMPAFAVGRAQLLLYYLHELKKTGRIPDIPVYLDSPMATSATALFRQYANEHRLSASHAAAVCKDIYYISTKEESLALASQPSPKLIISASGMASGGRVLQHLQDLLIDERNSVIFTGFQAEGTRGDRLVRGEQSIKIQGVYVPVKAEIIAMTSFSAHADADEILSWLRAFHSAPKKVFITHGELAAAKTLKERIETELGWSCIIPDYEQSFMLSS